MEPHAYHKAECWDDDDSFTVEWKMDVFQDVKALTEHSLDIKSATITETVTKIVKQVSKRKPAGITWVRLEPKAAVLTPNTAATTRTTRNTLMSCPGIAQRRDHRLVAWKTTSCSRGWALPMRAKGGSSESVTRQSKENLNQAVMNDTNSDVNSGVGSEEPEFVWALLCQATTHEPVVENRHGLD